MPNRLHVIPPKFMKYLTFCGLSHFWDSCIQVVYKFQVILTLVYMQVSSNSYSFHQGWNQMKEKVKLQSWLVYQLQLSFSAFWSCSWSWGTSKGRWGLPDKDRMKIRTQSMACTTSLTEATLMTAILKLLIAILTMLQYESIFSMQSSFQISDIAFEI